MSGPLDRARRLWPILRPSATGGALLAVLLLALISLPAAAATVEELRARADSGDVGALARLAAMYEDGRGVGRDLALACSLYQQAAEKGDADAQRALGAMYELGRGCGQDLDKAVFWYRKSAEQGVARAQANLGVLYEEGKGVEQDHAEAVRWYELSVGKGYPRGQYLLGSMYERGLGVARDLAAARGWYEKAAAAGYSRAMARLREMAASPPPAAKETQPQAVPPSPPAGVVETAPAVDKAPQPAASGEPVAGGAESADIPGLAIGGGTVDIPAAEQHFYLGNQLAGEGRLPEAIAAYEQSLALEPDNPNTLENIAITWAKLGELDKGLGYMVKAVEAAPADAGKHVSLGIMLHAAEKEDEAMARYRQAIRLDPTQDGVYFNMAVIFAGRHQYEKSWRSLQMGERLGRPGGELRERLAEQQPEPDSGWMAAALDGVYLRQIQVASRAEAEEVLRRLTAGEDFRTLAESLSIAPSRLHQGYLGRVTAGEIDAGLFGALRDLQPFAFSPVLETTGGWSVFQRLLMPEALLAD
ncbi:MAG: tetratricopeptide repeat protein [Thermodesulfobacteriota bacterium]